NNPAEELRQPPVDELAAVLDAARLEFFRQLRIVDTRGRELPRPFRIVRRRSLQRAADDLIADRDFGDLSALEQLLEVAVRNRLAAWREVIHLRQAEQQQEREAVPQR